MLSLVRFILGLSGSGSDAVGVSDPYPSLILNFISQSYEATEL